ncbi:D-mannonate oxidoreductase [Salmonella enterica subsp. enterica]|uniref:D-mannonate oxidoreductase n=1 Tax=Salmonella enterica I TaxID=59201 RepID=A0A379W2U9_SALET|nr:D-mannonate oxidoreductase [Salmonella enterica subsp. enterica]
MPGNDARLIANLKAQNLLYTVAERGAESTELKIIGSMKEALHPEFDGHAGILAAMARPETAIVSLTVTEKGYCTDPASGELDVNNPLIQTILPIHSSLNRHWLYCRSAKHAPGARTESFYRAVVR